MGYTVWTNSLTVAYKTRPAFHPQRGLTGGPDEEYTQETAYWFEPQEVVTGLSAAQARDVRMALERAAELSPIAGDDVKVVSRRLAFARKADVVIQFFWVTIDGLSAEAAADPASKQLATYGEPCA